MAVRGLLAAPLVVALVIHASGSAVAQTPRAGIVTAVQGQTTAARSSLTQPVPLKFKDDVFLQDRVETGDQSFARILLGGKALVTVREQSVLTITEIPGQATVDLARGRAVLSLGRNLLAPGESVEFRTPSAIAAVRGSTVLAIVENLESIAAFAVSRPVRVSLRGDPRTFVELGSHQMLDIVRLGPSVSLSAIRPVPPGLLETLEQPREGHIQELPDQVIERSQRFAGSQVPGFPLGPRFWPALGSSTQGVGVFENVCQNSPSTCNPPAPRVNPPPTLPPAPSLAPSPAIPTPQVGLPPGPPARPKGGGGPAGPHPQPGGGGGGPAGPHPQPGAGGGGGQGRAPR